MNLRTDIQKLAMWFIPTAIAALIASSWYSGLLKEAILDRDLTPGIFITSMSYIPFALNASVRLVIAIWLFYMVGKTSGNKYLWFLFGLVAQLFAVVIYIGLLIYEQLASNKSLNLTGAKNAPPS